jgi:hypothetical protein
VGEYHWGEAFRSEISTFLQYAALILAFWIKSKIMCVAGNSATVCSGSFSARF